MQEQANVVKSPLDHYFILNYLPVNRPKCVEVMHHYVMDILESIQFPEGVEVPYAVLPHPRNLTERPDSGAVCWK